MGGGTSLQTWIENTLAGGNPVAITIPVYDNFYYDFPSYPQYYTTYISGISGAYEGGHAVFASKYDASGLWIENSWGTGFGLNGYVELSWNFINQYAGDAVSIAPVRPPFQHTDAYVWSAYNDQHVDYIGTDAHVHELVYALGGPWRTHDLTAETGAPPVQPGSAIAGYTWSIYNDQHVDYIGTDGHIHELFLAPGGVWHSSDLTLAANAPVPASGSALDGYSWASDSSEHVNYISADGHVHELVLGQGGHWVHDDLTAYAGGAVAAPGSTLAAYVWPSDNSEHVIYTSADGHVHELAFRQHSYWANNDLTVYAGGPPAAVGSALDGYIWSVNNDQHVDYLSADGHVHELNFWPGGGWHNNDLTMVAGAAPAVAGSALDGYVYAADNSQHVDYLGADGHVRELVYKQGGTWGRNDLTSAAGAPGAVAGSALDGYSWTPGNDQHVDYISPDGHMHELDYWPTGSWHTTDLTTATGAAPL